MNAVLLAVVFLKAVPVWPVGDAETMNADCRLEAAFTCAAGEQPVLCVTGANVYRIKINGSFAGYGPARAGKGFFRVDEWPLAVRPGVNRLQIEAVAYNTDSYCFCRHPGFIQAEVLVDGHPRVWTAPDGAFRAYSGNRVRKTSRTTQRPFAECAVFGGTETHPLTLERRPAVRLMPRRAGYPAFDVLPLRCVGRSDNSYDALVRAPLRDFMDSAVAHRACFPANELAFNAWEESWRFSNRCVTAASDCEAIALSDRQGAVFDLGRIETGFTGLKVRVLEPCRINLFTDEVSREDGTIDHLRGRRGMITAFRFDRPGDYEVEAFEPDAYRFLNAVVTGGRAEIRSASLRTYRSPSVQRTMPSADPRLRAIYSAATSTFAQNAVDVFTDCPGRERAGWLCDSWFTARVSRLLTGSVDLETLFLENFALAEGFDGIPSGMFPMCYPGDHPNGCFIPNWAMWLVLELEEYARRGGDPDLIKAFEPRVMALLQYLDRFANADGLLERLPSWVFVEWSKANELVQDVNYPSNMTYAETLAAAGRLYGREDLVARAESMRNTIRRQSRKGLWFCDNAVRRPDGSLCLSGECTETCQYYAFFFGVATPGRDPDLWRTLVGEFGPDRAAKGAHPEIWPANSFIGNYLRLELLSHAGLGRQIDREIRSYFGYMAERTGTLWEMKDAKASCCHGFASYAAVFLLRDVLGDESVRKMIGEASVLEVR